MAKAVGQESPSGVSRAGVFDPQSLTQANQAFANLRSAGLVLHPRRRLSGNAHASETIIDHCGLVGCGHRIVARQ
jgi:hypothetical protein